MFAKLLRKWRLRNAPWVRPTATWFNDPHCAALESRLDRMPQTPHANVTYFRDRITGQLWAYDIMEAAPVEIMGYNPVAALPPEAA
jgi:hypothetical protein